MSGLTKSLPPKHPDSSTADLTLILNPHAQAIHHYVEELTNKLMDNLPAYRKPVGMYPHKLMWLADNAFHRALVSQTVLQQLGNNVRQKGLEPEKMEHPCGSSHSVDLNNTNREMLGRSGLNGIKDEHVSQTGHCECNVQFQTSYYSETEQMRGIERPRSSASLE